MQADLSVTNLLPPLREIASAPLRDGQRQCFVITDGEVFDTDAVIACAARYRAQNRCFALGVGRGADAGLVSGIARVSGGSSSFMLDGMDPAEFVIPQLE
jgi:hypothetical protein